MAAFKPPNLNKTAIKKQLIDYRGKCDHRTVQECQLGQFHVAGLIAPISITCRWCVGLS